MSSELHNYFTGNGTYKSVNPLISKAGDFTPFYITIAICTIILGSIIAFNVICCCSRYSDYWLDRHTGNRWIVSIWSTSPHKQPPLDFSELENIHTTIEYVHPNPNQYQQVQKRESEVVPSISQQPLTSPVYLELQKRESEI